MNVRCINQLIPDIGRKAKQDNGHNCFTKMAITLQQNVIETNFVIYRMTTVSRVQCKFDVVLQITYH